MSQIGTPKKGFNVMTYNKQKLDHLKKSVVYTDENVAVAIAGTITNNLSLGDEVDIRDVEQNGRGSYRLKMTNGQIFIIRVREEA